MNHIISLFSGCGGMDLGFIQAGYQVVWANEVDRHACETYRQNIGDHIIESDVKQLCLSELPGAEGIIGGFPCKDFSVMGKRAGVSGRYGDLYKYMVHAIRTYRPRFFVAENVPGLLSSNKGKDGAQIIAEFKSLGYNVITPIINFADYGVPQIRKRLLIIGTDFDYHFPFPTHKAHVTAGEALHGVGAIGHNNDKPHTTPKEAEVLPHIREGENAAMAMKRKPDLLSWQPFGHMYRRVHREKPSHTIVGTSASGGGTSRYHYSEHRKLTIRELARLFTFPDDFIFNGSYTASKNQLANSVPPAGIQVIAESLSEAMGGRQNILRHMETSYD